MQRNTIYIFYSKILCGLFLFSSTLAAQQFPSCLAATGNASFRSEGLTEGTTITLSCVGAKAGVSATAQVIITTSVNITNHLSSNNVPDVAVSVTTNGGFLQPAPQSIQLVGNNTINISGIQFTPGQDGLVTIKIANLRVDANAAASGASPLLTATLLTSGLTLANNNNQLQLGAVSSGLLSSQSTDQIFGSGAALPSPLNMQSLFAANDAFNTTRVTEGFANAFVAKGQDPNSDQGTRIMIQYSNLPASVQLVVPDLIAGSSAVQPTSGGDLGLQQNAGIYASSPNGSLLLARVNSPNPDGSGGAPIFTPSNTAQMTLSTATQLPVANGSALVVYEVVDSNPMVQESAQIPTYIGFTSGTAPGSYGGEEISFAPVSTVGIADMTSLVPRFAAVTPPGDCKLMGDCSATYFPHLKLSTSQVTLAAPSGGTPAVGYLPFVNTGGGALAWNLSVNYQNGSGWLTLGTTSGVGNATVGVHGNPANLAPGVYNATITVDAGPAAGSQSVPVVFTVGQALPLITQVSNAADGSVTSLVPGSLASVFGTSLAGNNLTVTFDGVAATTTYNSPTQINLVVPGSLTGKTSAQLLVSAGGLGSSPVTVNLANAAPAIFPNGVLNQDYSVNSTNHPAAHGSTLQIYLTGLPPVAGAMVNIGNQTLPSVFSGAAPGVPGLQQVNVMLPANLSGTAQLSVCTAGPTPVCTPTYSVTVQ